MTFKVLANWRKVCLFSTITYYLSLVVPVSVLSYNFQVSANDCMV